MLFLPAKAPIGPWPMQLSHSEACVVSHIVLILRDPQGAVARLSATCGSMILSRMCTWDETVDKALNRVAEYAAELAKMNDVHRLHNLLHTLLRELFLDRTLPHRCVRPLFGRQPELDPLVDLRDDVFTADFRFSKSQVARLAPLLLLPPVVKASNGFTASREAALCMLCASFAFKHSKDRKLRKLLRMSRAKFCGTLTKAKKPLLRNWRKKMRFDRRMVSPRAQMYAATLARYQLKHQTGLLVNDTIWGCVDSLVCDVYCPSHSNQAVHTKFAFRHQRYGAGL